MLTGVYAARNLAILWAGSMVSGQSIPKQPGTKKANTRTRRPETAWFRCVKYPRQAGRLQASTG